MFDDEKSGFITMSNLKRVAKELGENLSDDELQEMLAQADSDGDNQISEKEFIQAMQ